MRCDFISTYTTHLPSVMMVGRDLQTVSDAILYAKYLAADFRCLESDARPRLSIQVIGEGNQRIHEEAVFA
jgi:hypothetical protein